MLGTVVTPYLVWIKIGLIVLALTSLIGVLWYVTRTFKERDRLLADQGKLQTELNIEKQKLIVAVEQLNIWQDTVKKMNESVRNIKIQSDTYIQGIENEKIPVADAGASVAFILPGVPTGPHMPGYADYSSGRIRPAAAPR